MKKIIIFTIVLSLLLTSVTLAQPNTIIDRGVPQNISLQDLGVKDPTLLPGNFFYFLKSSWEWIEFVATNVSPPARIKLDIKLAAKRLAEANKLITDPKIAKLNYSLEKLVKSNTDISNKLERVGDKSEISATILENTLKQYETLRDLYLKSPESAQSLITEASSNQLVLIGKNLPEDAVVIETMVAKLPGGLFKEISYEKAIVDSLATASDNSKKAAAGFQEKIISNITAELDKKDATGKEVILNQIYMLIDQADYNHLVLYSNLLEKAPAEIQEKILSYHEPLKSRLEMAKNLQKSIIDNEK